MKRTPRGANLLEMKHWVRRSALISGALAATILAAELQGNATGMATCQPLTMRYGPADGGRIILATCWSAEPVLGPVIIHYELDLHLVIRARRVGE